MAAHAVVGIPPSFCAHSRRCHSALTRTVWEGSQILYEIRVPGDTNSTYLESDSYSGAHYGVVGYTHGGGIDSPLSIHKEGDLVLPHQNWRGATDFGTCPVTKCNESTVQFAGASELAYGSFEAGAFGPPSWYGSLIENQADGSGLHYKRNRYYEAATGRFTQEDPIGLAGGLNAYGFADGDPINFSDPFGLCTPWPDCLLHGTANWGAQHGGAIGSVALNGAAAANAAAESFAVNDLGRAVAARDGVGGAIALASMLPVGRVGAGLAKGMAKTVTRAQGATVAFDKLGKFTHAVWEVAGDKGAGYAKWNRVLNEEGSTLRLFKDVYNQGGKYLRRDWYVGGPK